MESGDFYGSEKSVTLDKACDVRIEFSGSNGAKTVLKDGLGLLDGEVIDTSVMNVKALRSFYAVTMEQTMAEGTLLSLHLKATMMKISDPIMFGHCVSVYFAEALGQTPCGKEGGDRGGHSGCLRQTPPAGHGRFPQGDHQPARA
jgi:isocitrate dehydrogenase